MATRTCIIAWRWQNLKIGGQNSVIVSPIGEGGIKRQLVQFKEWHTRQPNVEIDRTLEAIKREIRTTLTSEEDEVIVFLHKQKQTADNNAIYKGYTHASRHAILAMNTKANRQQVQCVLFGDDSFLYRNMLNANGDFGIKETVNLGVKLKTRLYENEQLDHDVFNLVWRYYLKEHVEYAEHIKSLFKNCLNHWLELPAPVSEKKHAMGYWCDELSRNKDLHAQFSKFVKFSPDPLKETPTKDVEEEIYQKSIAIIVSEAEAKQAYQNLKSIIMPSHDLKRQLSLRDIHQNMDKIRQRLG